MKPKVFIASSSEHLHVAYAVQENLQSDAEPTVWNQDVFQPGQHPIEGLLSALDSFDFAVFVFAPDDIVLSRSAQRDTPRDNVIFECGLFVGRLGRERTLFILPLNDHGLRLPSDLVGLTCATYDATRSDIRAALGPACNQLRSAVRRLGSRDARRAALIQTQKDVYVYVFNRLNPYSDISLTQGFLRNLPNKPFIVIDDVLYPLDSLVHNYVPYLIDDSMRVYFAYRVVGEESPTDWKTADQSPARYRIGISFSRRTDKWIEGVLASVPSNIHRTYWRKAVSKVRNAHRPLDTADAQNQRVEDEGSVIGVPVLYGDDDGHNECVGVVGVSSPAEDEATKPEIEALAQELSVLFSALFYAYGRYLQRHLSFDAVAARLRTEIADHFESKFSSV